MTLRDPGCQGSVDFGQSLIFPWSSVPFEPALCPQALFSSLFCPCLMVTHHKGPAAPSPALPLLWGATQLNSGCFAARAVSFVSPEAHGLG